MMNSHCTGAFAGHAIPDAMQESKKSTVDAVATFNGLSSWVQCCQLCEKMHKLDEDKLSHGYILKSESGQLGWGVRLLRRISLLKALSELPRRTFRRCIRGDFFRDGGQEDDNRKQ